MIKLTQIKTAQNKTVLIFHVDFPGGGMETVEVEADEIEERLKQLRQILGRDPTVNDFKDVVKTLFNQLRQGRMPFPQKIDLNSLLGVDFEA
jgi:cell fate (sporulation/competence/biofilm development) regulator YmcA (YheA/YmcA/DUF963 family)